MPITYRDHPLAFLQSNRPTPEILAWRAEDWRRHSYADHGLMVAETLDEAARTIVERRGEIAAIADMLEAGADRDAIDEAIMAMAEDGGDISRRFWKVGQGLRVGSRDPYGGSVASSVEMAADEMKCLGTAAVELRDLVENGADDRALLEIAAGAIDRVLAEPTHDAPVMTM